MLSHLQKRLFSQAIKEVTRSALALQMRRKRVRFILTIIMLLGVGGASTVNAVVIAFSAFLQVTHAA